MLVTDPGSTPGISTTSDVVGPFDGPPPQYIKIKATSNVAFLMHHYAYVLQSTKDKRLYIGVTTDLKRRLRQHARGYVTSTKNRRYLELIHYEYFVNKEDTEARERFLKSGAGHEQLRNILKRTLRHGDF